tara:strand:- start:1505 stop:1753 length:249 start_codon:yes stop_codon:yes gene_type:complete
LGAQLLQTGACFSAERCGPIDQVGGGGALFVGCAIAETVRINMVIDQGIRAAPERNSSVSGDRVPVLDPCCRSRAGGAVGRP